MPHTEHTAGVLSPIGPIDRPEMLAEARYTDLNGKRIGIRSYSVTTVTWVRGILQADFGLDVDSVKWVTFEDPHVKEFVDPPSVQRAAPAHRRASPAGLAAGCCQSA